MNAEPHRERPQADGGVGHEERGACQAGAEEHRDPQDPGADRHAAQEPEGRTEGKQAPGARDEPLAGHVAPQRDGEHEDGPEQRLDISTDRTGITALAPMIGVRTTAGARASRRVT
ncbi:MAG TPA: hypothetical protein VF406_11995 [Thermodesulfobacteriota bacterium]